MKRQKSIIIIVSIAILVLSFLFLSKKVDKETKVQLIKSINIELNNLPKNIEDMSIEKTYYFNSQNYTMKFKTSEKELDNWIKRNKKVLVQSEIIAGDKQFVFSKNQKNYFVFIKNNEVIVNF